MPRRATGYNSREVLHHKHTLQAPTIHALFDTCSDEPGETVRSRPRQSDTTPLKCASLRHPVLMLCSLVPRQVASRIWALHRRRLQQRRDLKILFEWPAVDLGRPLGESMKPALGNADRGCCSASVPSVRSMSHNSGDCTWQSFGDGLLTSLGFAAALRFCWGPTPPSPSMFKWAIEAQKG